MSTPSIVFFYAVDAQNFPIYIKSVLAGAKVVMNLIQYIRK